jgi:hypothetical protein
MITSPDFPINTAELYSNGELVVVVVDDDDDDEEDEECCSFSEGFSGYPTTIPI